MIPPTVIVGVGGQGSSIALRVKQRLTEYANERKHPEQEREVVERYVRIFAIDTKYEEGIHNRFPAGTYWIINPAGASATVRSLRREEARDEFFRRWWPRHISTPGDFLMGAGAMRAKGRLAYYLMGHGIADNIAASVNGLRHVRAADAGVQGAGADLPVYVIIAGSLSGGTGSGLLLTLAMHLRELTSGNVQMIGVVPTASVMALAPSKFLRENVWANASAGLRELEWWMTPPELRGRDIRPFFRLGAGGDTIHGDGSQGSGRPFDLCYLFTRNNRQGRNLEHHDEYTRLIADSIALDINSPVSDKSQAMLSNVMARMITPVRPADSKRSKPVLFASAGAASLTYPVRDIVAYLGLRLMGTVLDEYFLSPQDLGAYAANWIVAARLEERGQYNQVHEDLRKPFEDIATRQTTKLPPKPNIVGVLEGTSKSTVRQAVKAARNQFDGSWLKTLDQLADKNRQSLVARHQSAMWSELMTQLNASEGDGFERMTEVAKAFRTVIGVNYDDVDGELNKSETGRRAQLERLEAEMDRGGKKGGRGAIQELEASHGLFALPSRVRAARERFAGRWWNRYVDHREHVVTGEHVLRLYRELLLWLDVVVDTLGDVEASLRDAREELRRAATAQVGVRRRDALVLEERVLDDPHLIEEQFKSAIQKRADATSQDSVAMARSLAGALTPVIESLVDNPPHRPERRRARVAEAVDEALRSVRVQADSLFESEVAELSIWDALEQEYLLRRDLGTPDEHMRDIGFDRDERKRLDEVHQYITKRVKHAIATAAPFWQLDPARLSDNPEFRVALDGLMSYSLQPFEQGGREALRRDLAELAQQASLANQAGDDSPHRLTVTTREIGAPLFMLHHSERDELLDNERSWTQANGHVYIDQRYQGVLPPDFDLESLSLSEEEFSLPLALAFHFGFVRYGQGVNGRTNRGQIERTEDVKNPTWTPYAAGIVKAMARLHEEPGERAEFQAAIDEAWQEVPKADRERRLRETRQWVVSELGLVGRTPGDAGRREAFEAMKRALDAELSAAG